MRNTKGRQGGRGGGEEGKDRPEEKGRRVVVKGAEGGGEAMEGDKEEKGEGGERAGMESEGCVTVQHVGKCEVSGGVEV